MASHDDPALPADRTTDAPSAGLTRPEPVIGPSPGDTRPVAQDGVHYDVHDDAAAGAGSPEQPAPGPVEKPTPTLLEQMGGVSGMFASVIPVVVFIAVNQFFGLNAGIVAALASAVGIGVWRFVRKEGLQPAVSGALGVAVCAFIAWRLGEARGFFLYGIWASLVFAAAFAVSLVVRRPLVGVLWHGVRGEGQGWRADRSLVRAYDVATLVWVVVFAARFVVQRWLYDQDDTGALGVARLLMGLPLTALAALVTIWAARRAAKSTLWRRQGEGPA